MSTAVASFRRLLTASRAPRSGKVQIPSILASRGFCHRAALAKPVLVSPIATERLADALSRGYATTTTTKHKRKTTTTKKTTKPKKKKPAKKTVKKAKKKVVKKTKKRVVKKPKKPVAPTKPKLMKLPPSSGVSGYALFLKDALTATSGPGGKDRLAGASAQWRALSDAEKQPWITRAKAETATRKQVYTTTIAGLSRVQIQEENQKRRILAKKYGKTTRPANKRLIRDPKAPKRPTTGYLRFALKQLTPGVPLGQSSKASAILWKSMSDAEKRPYQQEHEAEKARYLRAKAAYLSS